MLANMSTTTASTKNLPSVQVKVTLPTELLQFVKAKADILGLSVATYVRHLVIEDTKEDQIPNYKMSEDTEEVVLQALEEHKQGRTKLIDDIDKFMDEL